MRLSDLSISRPVTATVFSILLVIFGVVGLRQLGVREYPAVDPPVVTVTTTYTGANPEVIESQITEPLEQQINGIEGIRTISSTSSEGRSQIKVEFDLEVDMERAANDVRDKVSGAIRRLPDDVDPPIIRKADADRRPIIFMVIESDTRSLLELHDYARNVVKERVQTINGVSDVWIFGERKYSMKLRLDPLLMAAHGVTPLDVEQALQNQNVDLPAGRLEGETVELTLRANARLEQPEEFNQMIIRAEADRLVRLQDIGVAELAAQDERASAQRNLQAYAGVAVTPLPNANEIAIADEFYRRMDLLEKNAPSDLTFFIGNDFTIFIRRAVNEVEQTLYLAFVLVAGIIFLFLRDWRTTLIPVVAIPISIVSVFFIIWVADYSINVLTMLALVLAIGLVVDDAIVVLENIYKKIEAGEPPLRAAFSGSREIYFAVISTTITLVTVFLPILFLEGISGRLFREFGVVLSGAVVVSSFVALTLSPMLCAYTLKKRTKRSLFYRLTEPFFQGLTNGYAATLGWVLRQPWLAVVLVLASAGGIYFLRVNLQEELAPTEDRSQIQIRVIGPEGSTINYTQHYLDAITQYLLDSVPEVKHSFGITAIFGGAPNTGLNLVYLYEPDERQRSQQEVYRQLVGFKDEITGVRVFPSQPPTIGDRFGGQPVQFVLQAPDLPSLLEVLPRFLDRAKQSDILQGVTADFKVNKPELEISVDRQRARELGVSVLDITKTLQLGLSGRRFGYFIYKGKQYEVIGQVNRQNRNAPPDLSQLNVRSSSGEMIPLSNLTYWKETVSPTSIYRYNRFISATISASPREGYTIGNGLAEMERVAREVVPEEFQTDFAGQSRDFAESASTLNYAFILALLLVFLVLAAQFESFTDPIIILLAVPLSLTGALGTLLLFGETLNIFSQIGIIMLVGLVTKNGILVVEFANQQQEQGLGKRQAAYAGAVSRFRPILMTTLATILGVLPIALNLGSSGGSRTSMGLAVIGGLVFSGLLSLYVIPVFYMWMARRKTRNARQVMQELDESGSASASAAPRDAQQQPGDKSGGPWSSSASHLPLLLLAVLGLAGAAGTQARAQAPTTQASTTQTPTTQAGGGGAEQLPAVLSLEDAIGLAPERFVQGESAELIRDLAVINVHRARNQLLPIVGLQLSTRFANNANPFNPDAPGPSLLRFDESASITAPLLNLSSWENLKVARAQADSQRISARELEDQIRADAGTFFIGCWQWRRRAELARQLADYAQYFVELAQTRLEVGTGAALDKVRFQSQAAQAQNQLAQAQGQLRLFRLRLGQYLNTDLDNPGEQVAPNSADRIRVDTTWTAPLSRQTPEPQLYALLAEAPSLLRARAAERAAGYRLRQTRRSRWPTLQFESSLGFTRFREFSTKPLFVRSFGLRLNLPLLNALEIRTTLQQRELQLRQAVLERNVLADNLRVQLAEAYATIRQLEQQLQAAQRQVALAQQEIELAQDLYREGLGSNVEVVNAQQAFSQANLQAIDLQAALARQQLLIRRLSGKLQRAQ